MKTASTFLNAGWSGSIWNIGDGINNGYPYLKWLNPSGTPLPVELTSITASEALSGAILQWKTATEINNYGFDVERRAVNSEKLTANSWSKIGFVQGNGTSNSLHEYSFVDAQLAAGTYAYRLKQIDNGGATKYSSEAEVTIAVPKVFALSQNYPNPFNPTTMIEFTVPEDGMTTLKVYDILGKEVATLVNENLQAGIIHQTSFNASRLSSGMYFYRLETNSASLVKKLVLLK